MRAAKSKKLITADELMAFLEAKPEPTVWPLPRSPEPMFERVLTLVSVLLLLSAIGVVIVRLGQGKAKDAQQQADQARIKLAITQLASTYKAVSDWPNTLDKIRYDDVTQLLEKRHRVATYDAEVSGVLIRRDGRPLLFVADVESVSESQSSSSCTFNVPRYELKLTLACSQESAKHIINESATAGGLVLIGQYALVGRISSVHHFADKQAGEAGSDSDGVEAYGTLDGLAFLGQNYFDGYM